MGVYPDGWTGCAFILSIEDWPTGSIELAVWNPTGMNRTLTVKTVIETIVTELGPQQHATVRVRVGATDSVEGSVSPAFIPGGADTRQLGIHLETVVPPLSAQ
jgi:hypothetical protein